MNLMSFIAGAGSQYSQATHAKEQARREARAAEKRRSMAESVKQQWLDALHTDTLRVMLSADAKNPLALRSSTLGLSFAICLCIAKFECEDHHEIRKLRGGLSAIKQAHDAMQGYISGPDALSIALAMEQARELIGSASPDEIISASFVFEERNREIMESGRAANLLEQMHQPMPLSAPYSRPPT